MICKKCGREYDDDMPKCLWCDAPNDSKVNSSGTNPADGTDPIFCMKWLKTGNCVEALCRIMTWQSIYHFEKLILDHLEFF